jgi:hypothetical protein
MLEQLVLRQTSIDLWVMRAKAHFKRFFTFEDTLKNPWIGFSGPAKLGMGLARKPIMGHRPYYSNIKIFV